MNEKTGFRAKSVGVSLNRGVIKRIAWLPFAMCSRVRFWRRIESDMYIFFACKERV